MTRMSLNPFVFLRSTIEGRGIGPGPLPADEGGLTLRDYLAAHCPLTLEEFRGRFRHHADEAQLEAGFALARYRYADAVLAARRA